jgi:hypothetical protein
VEEQSKQIVTSLKAMVYCLMKCIQELLGKDRKKTNYLNMKYLLQAVRFATKDMVE